MYHEDLWRLFMGRYGRRT